MIFTGYFDINGMTPHQAITHLTEQQQDNYKAQICAMLQKNHFVVDRFGIELELVADDLLATEQTPMGPQTVRIPRLRLQYTVNLQALEAPPPSGLIIPGQENGQFSQIMLVPLPEADTP
jgi:hypothetical protein